MYKTSLRNFVIVAKKKKAIQRHPIIVTGVDYGYIMDEIELCKKIEFERNVSVNIDEESH